MIIYTTIIIVCNYSCMSVPVITTHLGTHPHFVNAVLLTAKHNHVYVLGDTKNCKLFDKHSRITHLNYANYLSPDLIEFQQYFVNFSSNPASFEYACFERFFLLHQFMKTHQHTRVVYFDSDCVLLEDMNAFIASIPEWQTDGALSIVPSSDETFNSCACISNGLITLEFCEVFMQLCKDIYLTKTKLNWIRPKIVWHAKNNEPGGVCDMTLCNLIVSKNMVSHPLHNTNATILFQKEMCTFDHQFASAFGYNGEPTFVIDPQTKLKAFQKKNGKYYFITTSGLPVRALSLHFQGTAKRVLEKINPLTFFIPSSPPSSPK